MYRLLLLLAIFAFTDGRFCEKHKPTWKQPHLPPWRRHDPPANPPKGFSEIAQDHIDFEAALQNFCINNTKYRVIETYGSDNYILKYDIPEYRDAKFSVKIINHFMQITAEKENSDETMEEFRDVRLLPDILNYDKASWIFESKMLKIFVPYSIKFGVDRVKDCGTLNKNVIEVPVQKSENFNLRMLDDNSARNEIGRDELKDRIVY